ncbi:hypothetical protein SFC07_11480 [Corynebacterium callunae]|uniref:hypothetical protein n=1 Tax=Corynebacterium callunae TaxID=1721 RepID=UPI0039827B01
MVDSFYDGSPYDQETVRFYDVALEGAQVRLVGGFMEDGGFRTLEGLKPRSVVVLVKGEIAHGCARLVEALHAPLRQPLVITATLPSYIGALDVLVVVTEDGGDEDALRALITADQRGSTSILVGPAAGPLIEEVPTDTVVVPTLPTAAGMSPARVVASISTVIDLFAEDPHIVAARLEHVAGYVNEEIEALSPERDELVNPGRMLRNWVEGHRVIHSGGSELGMAIANVMAPLWSRRGLISAVLDYPELVVSLPDLRGDNSGQHDIFYDPFLDDNPGVVPFRAVVWAEDEPGIPDAMAQQCDGPSKGPLASALRLLTRGQAATTYSVEEKDL